MEIGRKKNEVQIRKRSFLWFLERCNERKNIRNELQENRKDLARGSIKTFTDEGHFSFKNFFD
jgi:hypothetical protein